MTNPTNKKRTVVLFEMQYKNERVTDDPYKNFGSTFMIDLEDLESFSTHAIFQYIKSNVNEFLFKGKTYKYIDCQIIGDYDETLFGIDSLYINFQRRNNNYIFRYIFNVINVRLVTI